MAIRLNKEKNPVNYNVKVPFLVTFIGSGMGTGFSPIASGTVGSLLAFGIYLLPRFSEWYYLLAAIIVFFFVGLYCSEKMRGRYGEDPAEVTIDEIVGLWFTYLVGSVVFELFFSFKSFDPEFKFATKFVFAAIGFLVFRFFDIIKLEPAKYFDRKDSGMGIMLDDLISGLYAGIFTSVITHFMWYKVLAHYFK
jgi:phosphatidylglycerophosphatase A